MRFDIHTHCKWSKQSELCEDYLHDMLIHAGRYLDGMALTEHFDSKHFSRIYDWLEEHAGYDGGHFVYEGLVIWPGIEVDVAEGGHIVVIGELSSIRSIDKALVNHRNSECYIELQSLLQLGHALGCVCIGAHPYRQENSLHQLDDVLLTQLDGLDLNGRDLYKYGPSMEKNVTELAKRLGLPVIGGSDTHHYEQYGVIWNESEMFIANASELKQALQRGSYRYMISEQLEQRVAKAEQKQKEIKQAGKYPSEPSEAVRRSLS